MRTSGGIAIQTLLQHNRNSVLFIDASTSINNRLFWLCYFLCIFRIVCFQPNEIFQDKRKKLSDKEKFLHYYFLGVYKVFGKKHLYIFDYNSGVFGRCL